MKKDYYKDIQCKIIDFPILLSAAILFFLSLAGIVLYVMKWDVPIFGSSYFIILSIFANLIIYKIIQVCMKIKNITFSRINIYIIMSVFLLVCVYYAVYLKNIEFIYYWDYSNYLNKQYSLENAFKRNILSGMANLLFSFAYDYTNFINIFTEFPFCMTPKTGDWYVFSQLFNIFLSILILLGAMIKKIEEIFEVKNKNIFFVISLLLTSLFSLLHKAALLGQPDWFGIVFCMIILLLTLNYKFEKPDIILYITLFVSTACIVLTRRWYMYFIVGYYICYSAAVIVHAVIIKEKNILINMFKFAGIAAVIMGVGFSPIIRHILQYNYKERYALYMKGGFASECISQMKIIGIINIALIIIGVIYAIVKKNHYIQYIINIMGIFISIYMFTRIQNMGSHQSLMLLPYYMMLLISGTAAVSDILKNTMYTWCWE